MSIEESRSTGADPGFLSGADTFGGKPVRKQKNRVPFRGRRRRALDPIIRYQLCKLCCYVPDDGQATCMFSSVIKPVELVNFKS